MIIKQSFPDQLTQWLETLGFQCKKHKQKADIFTVIEVWQANRFLLELKVVEISLWKTEGAAKELESYSDRQITLRKSGVFSVVLWEDMWRINEDIVRSRLKSILGISQKIPARLTYAARLYKTTAAEFLIKNHLQGSVSSKYRYGLYLPVRYFRVLASDFQVDSMEEDLLVAVATFSHARIFVKEEKPFRSFELIRFASLLNTTIVGGLNKLLSSFIKEFNPDDVMTYVDQEWSDGASYLRLGFEEISKKPPINFFLDTVTYERYTEANYSEEQNLLKIRNAGSTKFVRTIAKK